MCTYLGTMKGKKLNEPKSDPSPICQKEKRPEWHRWACRALVDATELWAPERPDTETVSFPKQSISRILDTKRGTHNTIQLFIHLTYLFFLFQICTCQILTHNCLYCILCFCHFVHWHLYFCILLVYCLCPVTVILLHCGASVTITNSSYV